MLFNEFNALEKVEAGMLLQKCCGSQRWKEAVLKHFPFREQVEFINVLNSSWYETCGTADWKEAFLHHPEIGDINTLQEKYSGTRDVAGKEQTGVEGASEQTLEALMAANKTYKDKFGFIFIVFASGRSADEMLELLIGRMNNKPEDEMNIAMGEQQKITMKRLKDQLTDLGADVSQITTHILDTSNGRPAAGVSIQLSSVNEKETTVIAQGVTNRDGRIPDLLPPARKLPAGSYRMHFHTEKYFSLSGTNTFFPFVEIVFNITESSHYHIPLLISPFGFTTYRGS